jgi:hypothetical protein
MKCRVYVTFEYDIRQPKTATYELEAGGPQTIAARAIRLARKDLKPVSWRSAVVLLDRLDAAELADLDEELIAEAV